MLRCVYKATCFGANRIAAAFRIVAAQRGREMAQSWKSRVLRDYSGVRGRGCVALLLIGSPCSLQPVVPREHGIENSRDRTVQFEFDERRHLSTAVYQGGRLMRDTSFQDTKSQRNHVMSITKSITALLVGVALDEGLLGPLDEPLSVRFSQLRDFPYAQASLRTILQQDSCFALSATISDEERNLLAYEDLFGLLEKVEASCAGERTFFYSNLMPNVVSQVLELATGATMKVYAERKLFAPLGITDWAWTTDRMGHTTAEAGLELTAVDLAKIGQLLLQDGVWQGEHILPKSFVDELNRPSPNNPIYSLLWWLRTQDEQARPLAREQWTLEGSGWAGQTLVIDRQRQRVTVVLTRPDWAWELNAAGLSPSATQALYERQVGRHDALLQALLAEKLDG